MFIYLLRFNSGLPRENSYNPTDLPRGMTQFTTQHVALMTLHLPHPLRSSYVAI